MSDKTQKEISNKVAREASQAIKRARKPSEDVSVPAEESIRTSLLMSEARAEAEGKDALSNLQRLRGGRLRDGDEIIVARRLHREMQGLRRQLRQQKILLRDFCGVIGIDDSGTSKELYRLTLGPDQDPSAVRLRKSADKYYRLIKGISKYGHRNLSSLADEILQGTSLHPSAHLGSMTEAEKLAMALQLTVDKIDREFNLYEKFIETAKLRSEFILAGIHEYWPLWGADSDDNDSIIQYAERAQDIRLTYWDKPELTDEKAIRMWEKDLGDKCFPIYYDSGTVQGNDFFYIPHVPFGVTEFVNIYRKQNTPEGLRSYYDAIDRELKSWRRKNADDLMSEVEKQETIKDDWDNKNLCPRGQLSYSPLDSIGSYFAWLIIYPTRDLSKLMLMFYVCWEEGGPYILPLNARNLEIFKDALWLTQTEETSAFDRVKNLLGYRSGGARVLEEALRRTAPWFSHNLIYKIAKRQRESLLELDVFCEKLWTEMENDHESLKD